MENGAQVGGQTGLQLKRPPKRVLGKIWGRWIFERVRMSSWSCRLLSGSDSNVVNCSLSPGQSASQAQCNTITHLFGPKASVSLGAAIKSPSAWKCGITDKLLQDLVALRELFTTQAVNHTHHIVTHSSNVSLLPSLSVWLTACYCTTSASHPVRCVIVISVTLFYFPRVPGKWMEQVSVGLFSVGNGIWWFAPKTWHLTKRGTGSKNTRHCLWDPPRKLKQSLALFNSIHLANGKRLL